MQTFVALAAFLTCAAGAVGQLLAPEPNSGTQPAPAAPAPAPAAPATANSDRSAEPPPAAPDPAPPTAGADAKGGAKWTYGPEPKIETKPDGSTVVDGRFTIVGDGTAEKPFEIPWEMLVSAQESFAPEKKLRTIPGRLKMLDGKVVRISGNILFPLFVKQPKELLTMLNQWDGCCIGVPPTPYDAVEVKLSRGVLEGERYATRGTVTGTFAVKPFLSGDWLVGLYTLEKADFSVTAAGSANGKPQGMMPQ